jgi:DNA polymerase III delta subunit
MPFIIIHGDHLTKSRQALATLKDQASSKGIHEMVTLDGKSCDFTAIVQDLESDSMFGSSRLTIIEQLHKRRSKTELKTIITYLASLDPKNIDLVLYESTPLTATQLKQLKPTSTQLFKLPSIIFKLTDSISNRPNLKTSLQLLNETQKHEASELILIMLARHLKTLIQVHDPAQVLTPYQQRLVKPAKTYGLEKLITLHHHLADIDYRNKTGQLATDLKSELANWLITVYSK